MHTKINKLYRGLLTIIDYCCMCFSVESEGLKQADAWFVESLTVITEEGSKWHCPCNQWLSLHHSDCQVHAPYLRSILTHLLLRIAITHYITY